MSLTKLALKRPVSVILIILALAVFGLSSIPGFKMQLTPDMDMPMLIVMTTYPGADPESVDELVTKVVEDSGSTLNGIDSVTSQSAENVSMVMFSYEYGVDIDECYADLRTALDTASLQLPEDASTPVVIELNMSQSADDTECPGGRGIGSEKDPGGYPDSGYGIHNGCSAGGCFGRNPGLYPGPSAGGYAEAVWIEYGCCCQLSGGR